MKVAKGHGWTYSRCWSFLIAVRKCNQTNAAAPIPPISTSGKNIVGPPDKESNLRPVVYHVSKDETRFQEQFRLDQMETQEKNQKFWSAHNNDFYKAKEEFVTKKLHENKEKSGVEAADVLTPEEMSIFYRKFLDENYKKHMVYQKWWYKKNISSLWPALKISVQKIFSRK